MNFQPAPVSSHRRPTPGHYEHCEVSYEYSGGRNGRQTLGGACCGAIIGLLLLLGASALLWINEGVAVRTARSLDEAQAKLWHRDLEDAPVGALVHAIGMLRSEGSLQDADWGLSTSGLTLKRLVEVYQWKETKTTRSQDVRGPAGQM
eukprot:2323073-Prymnesium_polylepis.1